MMVFLIGHRGVGKTELLKRIESYYPQSICMDLDATIVKTHGPISDLFEKGEAKFRKIELSTLDDILKSHQSLTPLKTMYIALGAGFELSKLPKETTNKADFIWIRRRTDSLGRIFLDRPRLNSSISPIEEFKQRFAGREALYKSFATDIFEMQEGADFKNKSEERFFTNKMDLSGASLSFLPWYFKTKDFFQKIFNKRSNWNLSYLEFRDDLIDSDKLIWIPISKTKILYSFRNATLKNTFSKIKDLNFKTDWPLELGPPPGPVDFLSIHSKDLNFENFNKYQNEAHYFKYSPFINSFSELKEGHSWHLSNPEKNIFLPREEKWQWYRLLMKNLIPLNFIREDDGTSLAQPTLMQWLNSESKSEFSAVLGSPISHSRSPMEHLEFTPFFNIDISQEEFPEAIQFLDSLGLKRAAVTSPLKQEAFGWTKTSGPSADKFKSANTLVKNQKAWYCENTDIEALKIELMAFQNIKSVAIWGGGGTLKPILDILPQAHAYSASIGAPRPDHTMLANPELVIWAATANASPGLDKIPITWRPKTIFDLNYTENSNAREFAQLTGAKYISGLNMFKLQAQKQKEIWTLAENK